MLGFLKDKRSIMNEIIEKIRNRNFTEAEGLINNFQEVHSQITETAYETEDEVFCEFYEFLLSKDYNNPELHYALAELYTSVFNFLPSGYKKAFTHGQIAIKLAPNELSYKEFILLFYTLPTPILSKEKAEEYANEILECDRKNKAARFIKNSLL